MGGDLRGKNLEDNVEINIYGFAWQVVVAHEMDDGFKICWWDLVFGLDTRHQNGVALLWISEHGSVGDFQNMEPIWICGSADLTEVEHGVMITFIQDET